MDELSNRGIGREKLPVRHTVAAVTAVVSSVVLHALFLSQFPPVAVGRPARLLDHPERTRSLVLDDVRRQTEMERTRPERFSAEDPEQVGHAVMEADAFRELLAEYLPPEPDDPGLTLTGEAGPVAEPEPETERPPWDPRQDLVQIRDRIVPDEVSALPRRLMPAMERSEAAQDIALPAEEPGAALTARGDVRRRVGARYLDDPPDDEVPDDDEPDSVPPGDLVDAIPESPQEVTDAEAIEELLALDLQTYRDPADPEHVYFQIQIRRTGPQSLPVLPKDVLLIQDASSSMTQETIDRCKEGLRHWLALFNEGDRFDIIAFRNDLSRAFGEPADANPLTRSRANFFIENMRAQRGTDVFASLAPLLTMDVPPERPVIAVMISDGVPTTGVVDSTEILERFSAANEGRVSVFSVGAGPDINRYLLDFLSYKNRGEAVVTRHRDEIPATLERLAREVSRPILVNLRMNVAGAEDVEIYPRLLTHLYMDRPLLVYGRKPVATHSGVIQLVGRSGVDVKDMLFRLDFEEAARGEPGIRTAWAWQKVHHLVGEHIRTGDSDLLGEIRRKADRFNLRVLYGADTAPGAFSF